MENRGLFDQDLYRKPWVFGDFSEVFHRFPIFPSSNPTIKASLGASQSLPSSETDVGDLEPRGAWSIVSKKMADELPELWPFWSFWIRQWYVIGGNNDSPSPFQWQFYGEHHHSLPSLYIMGLADNDVPTNPSLYIIIQHVHDNGPIHSPNPIKWMQWGTL